jgi:GT2 family glycosyltransferase
MGVPNVAVVIASRDRGELLKQALASLPDALRPGDQALVVDSCSRTAAVRRAAEDAGVRVVRAGRPGLAHARNLGVAETSAPVLAFTDDDCLLHPGWTASILAAFNDPGVGFVTGAVHPDRSTPRTISVTLDAEPARYRSSTTRGSSADTLRSVRGHGANMAWRRAVLAGIGGFDEALGAGGRFRSAEDTDAFWRALRAGWEGRYEPALVVTHQQWRGHAGYLTTRFGYGYGAGGLAAKQARLGDLRWRAAVGWAIWHQGARQAWKDLRDGYQTGAAGGLAQAAGAAVGVARGARYPLVDEMFGAGQFT